MRLVPLLAILALIVAGSARADESMTISSPRVDKHVGVAGGAGLGEEGGEAFYNVDAITQVGVRVVRGSGPQFDAQHGLREVELFGRGFCGNSLHIRYGVGVRQTTGGWGANPYDGTAPASFDTTAIVAVFGGGNQWTWGNGLFFNFEWYTWVLPIATWSHSRVHGAGPASEGDAIADEASDKARNIDLRLLTLSLGYQF